MRLFPVLALLLAGCASASGGGGPTYIVEFRTGAQSSRHEFSAPLERVREALPQVYAQIGFPGGFTSGAPNREFMTPYLQVKGQLFGLKNSEFFDCGGGGLGIPTADSYEIVMALITRLEPARNGGTVVLTQLDAKARRRGVNSHGVECASTGKLEAGIAELLMERLRS